MIEPFKNITSSLPVSTHETVDAVCAKTGREKSEVINLALIEYGKMHGIMTPASQFYEDREVVLFDFAEEAVQLYTAEGPRHDIIPETAKRLVERNDPWVEKFKKLNGGALYGGNTGLRRRINPLLGKRARARLGAVAGDIFAVSQPSIFVSSTKLTFPSQSTPTETDTTTESDTVETLPEKVLSED